NTHLSQLKTKTATQGAEETRLAEALKASEDTKSKLNDTVAQQRQTMDTLQSQSADMNRSINDLTARLDVTEKERRNFAEQLEQQRQNVDKLGKAFRDLGGNPQLVLASPSPEGAAAGAPRINGVIREVRNIA